MTGYSPSTLGLRKLLARGYENYVRYRLIMRCGPRFTAPSIKYHTLTPAKYPSYTFGPQNTQTNLRLHQVWLLSQTKPRVQGLSEVQ